MLASVYNSQNQRSVRLLRFLIFLTVPNYRLLTLWSEVLLPHMKDKNKVSYFSRVVKIELIGFKRNVSTALFIQQMLCSLLVLTISFSVYFSSVLSPSESTKWCSLNFMNKLRDFSISFEDKAHILPYLLTLKSKLHEGEDSMLTSQSIMNDKYGKKVLLEFVIC